MQEDQTLPTGQQSRTLPVAFKIVFATNYIRYERRDNACPNLTLQQWFTDWGSAFKLLPPEKCEFGEWRDVPIVNEPPGPKTFTPISKRVDEDVAIIDKAIDNWKK
jgi:hypothetical protein